jgi:hypothetical protein
MELLQLSKMPGLQGYGSMFARAIKLLGFHILYQTWKGHYNLNKQSKIGIVHHSSIYLYNTKF